MIARGLAVGSAKTARTGNIDLCGGIRRRMFKRATRNFAFERGRAKLILLGARLLRR
jgi:hypothetical protein